MNAFDDMLPDYACRELRRPLLSTAIARRRVMSAVRREALARQRGGWLTPAAGIAVAACLTIGVALGPAARWMPGRSGGQDGTAEISAIDTALRDTLMLIRFAMASPHAARVALVGDFNQWHPGATALSRGARAGEWSVTVALAAGTHRYAFVVDDTEWVTDLRARQADVLAPNGRRASRLIVPKPD